jgi:hypothetical protein
MNFLIDLFKKAFKGDNFRTAPTPIKYNDKIAQLNTQAPKISKIQKTGNSVLTQNSSTNNILPGSK